MNLKELVFQAMQNAKDNGYHFEGLTSREIAEDMVTYDAFLEQESIEDVEKLVIEFQAKE